MVVVLSSCYFKYIYKLEEKVLEMGEINNSTNTAP